MGLLYHGYPRFRKSSLLHLSPLTTLAMLTLVKGGPPLHNLLQDQFQKKYLAKFPEQPLPGNPEVIETQIAIWERALRTQWQVANTRHAPLFIFVQPNQYNEDSKPFSEWELAHAISPSKLNRGDRLAALRERAQALKQEGLPIYDLTQVFSKTTETVYTDTCCHINSFGNQIVAQAIADHILTALLEPAAKKTRPAK
ncbi:MAG: hypothetical protein IT288_01365 [Bdellovibrionales bacterium]|nr:hypothetical protein [Bdellovibrionales bacterium]